MSDEIKRDEVEEIAYNVYEAIFSNRTSVEIDGEVYPIEKTSKNKVRLIRHDNLTYIEQNPNKSSHWAKEARSGHKILWVMRNRRYLFRIMDGNFLDLRKK